MSDVHQIYEIEYGTIWKVPNYAIVAAEDPKEAISLLEVAIQKDERIKLEARQNIGIDFINIRRIDFKCDKKGVLYLEGII